MSNIYRSKLDPYLRNAKCVHGDTNSTIKDLEKQARLATEKGLTRKARELNERIKQIKGL